jgi:glycosyltransferase involved in cell wall biosynthesis
MISVITTAYNEEKHIDRYFDSILNQTYRDLEVVVVDDGSTDSTWDIIQRRAALDPRVQAIHQQNQGAAAARNTAMKVMSGDYVIYFDADDWMERECLEQAYQAAAQYDADMVMWGFQKEFPDGTITPQKAPPLAPGLYTGEECRQAGLDVLHRMGRQIDPVTWIRLIRTSTIKDHGLWFDPSIKRYDDYHFICRAHFYCSSIFSMGDRMYVHWWQHGRSIMHTYFKEFYHSALQVCDGLRDFYRANDAYTQEVQMRLDWAYLYIVTKAVRQERFRDASDEEKVKMVDAILAEPQVRESVARVDAETGEKLFGERYIFLRDQRSWDLLNAAHL